MWRPGWWQEAEHGGAAEGVCSLGLFFSSEGGSPHHLMVDFNVALLVSKGAWNSLRATFLLLHIGILSNVRCGLLPVPTPPHPNGVCVCRVRWAPELAGHSFRPSTGCLKGYVLSRDLLGIPVGVRFGCLLAGLSSPSVVLLSGGAREVVFPLQGPFFEARDKRWCGGLSPIGGCPLEHRAVSTFGA